MRNPHAKGTFFLLKHEECAKFVFALRAIIANSPDEDPKLKFLSPHVRILNLISDYILDVHTSMPKINSFDKINKMGKLGLLEALVYACFIIAPRQAEKYKLFDENGKRYNISEVPAETQSKDEEPDLEATSVSEPNEPTAPAEIIVEEQTPSNSPRIPKSVLAAMAEWLIRKLDESSEPLTRDIIREELKVQFPECELNNSYFGLVMKAVFGRRPALKAKISVASNSIKNEKKPLTEEDTFNIGKLEKAQGFGVNDPLAELILNTVSNAPGKRWAELFLQIASEAEKRGLEAPPNAELHDIYVAHAPPELKKQRASSRNY